MRIIITNELKRATPKEMSDGLWRLLPNQDRWNIVHFLKRGKLKIVIFVDGSFDEWDGVSWANEHFEKVPEPWSLRLDS